MACRDMEKAEQAEYDIREEVENADIVLKKLDLSSLASVRQCAEDIVKEFDKIDILVNNAGIFWSPMCTTKDGFNIQFGINHLGSYCFRNFNLKLIYSQFKVTFFSLFF